MLQLYGHIMREYIIIIFVFNVYFSLILKTAIESDSNVWHLLLSIKCGRDKARCSSTLSIQIHSQNHHENRFQKKMCNATVASICTHIHTPNTISSFRFEFEFWKSIWKFYFVKLFCICTVDCYVSLNGNESNILESICMSYFGSHDSAR